MFYKLTVKDHVRVPPIFFGQDVNKSVEKSIRQKFSGFIDQDMGVVVDVVQVNDIGEGVIIPCDGATFYETKFDLLVFKPEQQEVVKGKIKDITDFGAFITLGPIDGMIHVSQTMDDFVSFSKEKVLTGRDSKRSLKVGDFCWARIVQISFKDLTNPKIGLTMRQDHLGKQEWWTEDVKGKKK
ncbi:DNA-directed RNA polymerase [Candidatus Woesearchaeota archaeon CG10_big_fil_rev_8_21_14_0_10_30_7]|nr:MAG: DNA-directed RNA polymerase [Candidatus Woesearchaeota archaeon CG10_big_fil_rev_8_21_14_0_10_30_7]